MTLTAAFRYLFEVATGKQDFDFRKLLEAILLIGGWVLQQVPDRKPGDAIPMTAPITNYTDEEVRGIVLEIEKNEGQSFDEMETEPLALFGFDKIGLMIWVLRKAVQVMGARGGK